MVSQKLKNIGFDKSDKSCYVFVFDNPLLFLTATSYIPYVGPTNHRRKCKLTVHELYLIGEYSMWRFSY